MEACDDGNDKNNDGCTSECKLASCGDGVVQPGEQCDDGNVSNADGCLSTCLKATCGDGFVQNGVEECDDANASNYDACLGSCLVATCGDGFVHSGVEACDDGNDKNDDGCTNECKLASCGDGVVEPGEQCDDANVDNTDGCLSTCLKASCGDGFLYTGVEQCDDGNQSSTDFCTNGCLKQCIVGNQRAMYGGRCYFIMTTGTWWTSAQSACGIFRSHLVSIEDVNENNAVQNLLNAAASPMAWIGANDWTVEGLFVWDMFVGIWPAPPSIPLSYTRWLAGQPDNNGGADFGLMTAATGQWSDEGWIQLPYVCEYEWP
ncbi:MAG: DUF4215 domain-containing protein [Deltaproteobacteria bacterium]|nr:DUF4215 domain-containing protein [Deltaproteobacteria bacterium]